MMLIETIRIFRRKAENLPWHQARLEHAQNVLFGKTGTIDLEHVVKIPRGLGQGLYKCRVLYDIQVNTVDFEPYFPKVIKRVALVHNDEINYSFKFADRHLLQQLLHQSGADEIILVKHGFITDTSFSNLAFFDGTRWLTPATPLLEGTRRTQLISAGDLIPAEIKVADLAHFQSFKLINALLPMEESQTLPITVIQV